MPRRHMRLLLTLALLVTPLAVEAQPAHVPRIGVLAVEGGMLGTPDRFQAEFSEALRAHGYVEGQTIRVDYGRVAAGHADRLHDQAAELVRLPVDLIVAVSTPAAQAAKRATLTLPIIFIAGDPVGTGLVASLSVEEIHGYTTPTCVKDLVPCTERSGTCSG